MSASPQRRKSRNQTAIGTGRSVSALLPSRRWKPQPLSPRLRLRPTRKINPALGGNLPRRKWWGSFFEPKCTAGERALPPVFEAVFREFGLPKAIRTDNGVLLAMPPE